MSLAENLRYAREAQGVSRKDLAERGGTTYKVVAAIENRRLVNPASDLVEAMARVLGVTTEELLGASPLDEALRLYQDIQREGDRAVIAWANKSLVDLGRILRSLVSDEFVPPVPHTDDLIGLEIEWLTALVSAAHMSVSATTCLQKNDWWNTKQGREYLRANVDLVGRGVAVRRIFVFADQRDFDSESYHLRNQRTFGIAARHLVLTDDSVLAEDRRLLLEAWDMALIDGDWLIYLPHLSRQQMHPLSELTRDRNRISSARNAFDRLWELAREDSG